MIIRTDTRNGHHRHYSPMVTATHRIAEDGQPLVEIDGRGQAWIGPGNMQHGVAGTSPNLINCRGSYLSVRGDRQVVVQMPFGEYWVAVGSMPLPGDEGRPWSATRYVQGAAPEVADFLARRADAVESAAEGGRLRHLGYGDTVTPAEVAEPLARLRWAIQRLPV